MNYPRPVYGIQYYKLFVIDPHIYAGQCYFARLGALFCFRPKKPLSAAYMRVNASFWAHTLYAKANADIYPNEANAAAALNGLQLCHNLLQLAPLEPV